MAHSNPYALYIWVVFHPLSTRFFSLLNWKPEARRRSTRTVIHPQGFPIDFQGTATWHLWGHHMTPNQNPCTTVDG